LLKYDLNNKCVSLKAIEVPILDLETMSNINILKLRNEIERTLTEDKPEAIIICGLGMLKLSKQLQDEYEIPVIEGVSSAITMAESLIKLGFKINKLDLKHSMSQRYSSNLSEFINKE
jgi:allantoin racemase